MTAIFAAKKNNPQQSHAPAVPFNKMPMKLCALASLTFLAACQTIVPRGGQVPASAPVPAVVVPADGKHHVALLLPITGPDGDVGRSLANAAAMALVDTKNTSITLKTYDTANGAAGAAQLAVAEGNKLILGPLRGDNVVTVAGIAQPKNIPIISFSNDAGVANQNVFLLGHLPNQSVDRIIRYAKSRGLNRFGAIVSKNVYGQRASSNFIRSVRNAGGTLVSVQEIDGSTASIDAATSKLQTVGQIDAVLLADTGSAPLAIVGSLRSHGMESAQILGTELWNINGGLAGSSMMNGAWFASVSDGYYRSFADKYRVRYGKVPLRLASLGYDSILLTIRVAQNWKLGTTFPIERLTASDGFIGVDGAFRFTRDGLSERMLEVQEIQPGKFVTIDAAPQAFKP
jgi:branched-chain amino acid transport system substrate-binding protein